MTAKASPFKTAYYDFLLPVFKQGDDLAYHLSETEGAVADAFEALAAQYEGAAAKCRRMAGVAREVPELKVTADTHNIFVQGPVERLSPLVEQELLSPSVCAEGSEGAFACAFMEHVLHEFDEKGSFTVHEVLDRLPEVDEDFTGVSPVWAQEILEEMVEASVGKGPRQMRALQRRGEGVYEVVDL